MERAVGVDGPTEARTGEQQSARRTGGLERVRLGCAGQQWRGQGSKASVEVGGGEVWGEPSSPAARPCCGTMREARAAPAARATLLPFNFLPRLGAGEELCRPFSSQLFSRWFSWSFSSGDRKATLMGAGALISF